MASEELDGKLKAARLLQVSEPLAPPSTEDRQRDGNRLAVHKKLLRLAA